MKVDLVSDALQMALEQRRPAGTQLLHHSDRGSQYASEDYQQLLARHGITVSMSRCGDCYDNAMMESFWATPATELVHQKRYATWRRPRHRSLNTLKSSLFEAA